jgi:hypothetical protein
LDLFRKKSRRDQHVGNDDGHLRIGGGKGRQLLRALHDAEPVVDHQGKSRQQPHPLDGLAAQQRDLFGVFPRPHQIETEIGLKALLLEIEIDQRPADQMGQQRPEQRVDQGAPHQIAGNRDVPAEQMQRRFVGQAP